MIKITFEQGEFLMDFTGKILENSEDKWKSKG